MKMKINFKKPDVVDGEQTDYEKYKKHIFYVDSFGYEVQVHNNNPTVSLKLFGRSTSSIPGEDPADMVQAVFYPDDYKLKKPKYDKTRNVIVIEYPMSALGGVMTALCNSPAAYAQFFYYGKNCYADIHGGYVLPEQQ